MIKREQEKNYLILDFETQEKSSWMESKKNHQ